MDITDSGSYRDIPQQIGQKEYAEWGGNVSLMLSMCKPIFGIGKDMFFYSVFVCPKVLPI